MAQTLVNHRVEEGKVVEADLPSEDVLDHMPVEENGAQLVLQHAEADEAANVAERVQSLDSRLALARRVETALARAVEERRVVLGRLLAHLLRLARAGALRSTLAALR